MILQPLSLRVVLLSWAAALLAWPCAWLLLAVAQGLGVVLAGGQWIGVAVPWAAHPWGLVNEPSVSFAMTRGALWGYWLAPLLAAALLALLPPLTVSTRGWPGELLVFQLSSGAALLGLGWAPSLGAEDGPAAGLARFAGIDPRIVIVGAAATGAVALVVALLRLAGHLWARPGGPLRGRRVAVWALHGALPALGWLAAVALSGWAFPARAWLPLLAVVAAGGLGSLLWLARAPLRPRPALSAGTVAALLVLGLMAAAAWEWAGAPGVRSGKALLWGTERMTSNVRPGMVRVRLLGSHPPGVPGHP